MAERAAHALAELDAIANLAVAVHERARHSPALAEVHEEFHAEMERRARVGFEEAGLAPEQAGLAAKAVIAMVEGIHLHDGEGDCVGRECAERDELVLWAIARFLDGA
jgi:hypothetical protein